jgi:hypothetical protein
MGICGTGIWGARMRGGASKGAAWKPPNPRPHAAAGNAVAKDKAASMSTVHLVITVVVSPKVKARTVRHGLRHATTCA